MRHLAARRATFSVVFVAVVGVVSTTTAEPSEPPAAPGASEPVAVTNAEASAPAVGAGIPILVAGEEIYRVRAPLGPFSAEERAAAAAKRIHDLVVAPDFEPAKIAATEHAGQTRIAYGVQVLFTVLPDDLSEVEGETSVPAAQSIADRLRAAIVADRAARTPKRLLISIGISLLVLGVAAVFLRIVFRLGRRVRARIASAEGVALRDVRIRGLELISAATMVTIAQRAASLVQAAILVLLAYVGASIVLSLFPWTAPYVRSSVAFVLKSVWGVVGAIVGYIPNLFMIVLLVLVIRYITRFVSFLFEAVGRGVFEIPGFHPELAAPTNQLARWLVWTLGLVVIFPYLPGSGSPAFQGIGLFVGLLVSLGSSGAIGNLVSGVVLTYSRSFSVGDRVKIAETIGDVVSRNLLSTKLVTIKHEEVTIPNSAILGSHIINYTELAEEKGLILHTTVTIGYDAPWRQVRELLIAAARATDGVVADPAPFVFQVSLDDFYVSYEINAYTKTPQRMASIYSDLHQNIQDRFYEAGVEIMSPHYASLRDGNTVAIPPDKRPASYEPGTFRVRQARPQTEDRS